MATVVQVTDAVKVPVFPSADTMVADGGVLGVGVDQYQIGVETAKSSGESIKRCKPSRYTNHISKQRCCLCQRRKKRKN